MLKETVISFNMVTIYISYNFKVFLLDFVFPPELCCILTSVIKLFKDALEELDKLNRN